MSYPQSTQPTYTMDNQQPVLMQNQHHTGMTSPPPMASPEIHNAPPTYGNTVTPQTNEKHDYNQYPPQSQQQQPAFQQGISTQSVPQAGNGNMNAQRTNVYQSATPIANLQQSAQPVDCPVCGVREMTRTEYVSGGTTHVSAILLCCCLCLGCIPYIASWFKDCEHKCGNCGTMLAVWHRSGRTEVLAHGRQ